MIGGLAMTIGIFVVAIALCVVINFVVCKHMWNGMAPWMQSLMFISCVTFIFFVAYHAIGQVWGVK